MKTLRCGDMYVEYALMKTFIKDLGAIIRHSICEYLGGEKEANLDDVAIHATPRFRLKRHDLRSKRTHILTAKQHRF